MAVMNQPGVRYHPMSRDHLEAIRLTEELEALRLHVFYAPVSESDEQALRRVL